MNAWYCINAPGSWYGSMLASASVTRPQSIQSTSERVVSNAKPDVCVSTCRTVMLDFPDCANSGQYCATGASSDICPASSSRHNTAAAMGLPAENARNIGRCDRGSRAGCVESRSSSPLRITATLALLCRPASC